MYLERYCAHDVTIQDLLKVPGHDLFKTYPGFEWAMLSKVRIELCPLVDTNK